MTTPATSEQLLDREYLPVRAKILEIAAAFDRIQRAPGDVRKEDRWKQLQAALERVLAPEDDRTEQLQLHFSRPYDPRWREAWSL